MLRHKVYTIQNKCFCIIYDDSYYCTVDQHMNIIIMNTLQAVAKVTQLSHIDCNIVSALS